MVGGEQFDEMPKSENRAVQNIRRAAVTRQDPISKEVDLKGGELVPPVVRARRNRMTRPDPQRAMEAVGDNCIGRKKRPIGEDR